MQVVFFKILSVGLLYRAWCHWKGVANRYAVTQAILRHAWLLPSYLRLKVQNGNYWYNEQNAIAPELEALILRMWRKQQEAETNYLSNRQKVQNGPRRGTHP